MWEESIFIPNSIAVFQLKQLQKAMFKCTCTVDFVCTHTLETDLLNFILEFWWKKSTFLIFKEKGKTIIYQLSSFMWPVALICKNNMSLHTLYPALRHWTPNPDLSEKGDKNNSIHFMPTKLMSAEVDWLGGVCFKYK